MSEELIKSELETLKEDVAVIKVDVKAIRDWQLTTRLCPMPGTCMALNNQTDDHEKRLRFLERFVYGVLGVLSVVNVVIALAK